MAGFLQLATDLPIVFGLVITFALLLLSIASFMLGMALPAGKYKPHLGQILGRLGSTLIFVFILWQFGWLTASGFTRSASWESWLPILLWLVYKVTAAIYVYFGDWTFDLSKPKLALVVAANQMTIGLIEETACRGVILYAFVRLWGDSTWGLVGSVLLSALFFGASHLIWIAFGKPPIQITLTSLNAFAGGIYYGAIVLASGSIWPAVVFHGVLDAVAGVKLIGKTEYQEPGSAGKRMIQFNLPIVIYAVYLLLNLPPFAVVPNVP